MTPEDQTLPTSLLTHEALTVTLEKISFYRNGDLLSHMPMSRVITDCINPGTVELGDEGITLSDVLLYPRELNPSEVFRGLDSEPASISFACPHEGHPADVLWNGAMS